MSCYHPITAYQSVNPTGKKQIYFGSKPLTIATSLITLPCNKCIGCRLDYGQEWGARMHHESQMHDDNMFLTLTFDQESVPHDRGLKKTHMQLFMKRFRKYLAKEHPGKKISYFQSGEYGESETTRPHYHAIIFGFAMPDMLWIDGEETHKYYTSETLNKIWGNGNVIIADVTPESCNYVARYLLKDLRTNNWESDYDICDPSTGEIHQRIKPFSSMSTKPAIGKSWYEKHKTDCFPSGFLINQGKRMPIPGYYLNLLQKEDPEQHAIQKEIRRKALTTDTQKRNNKPERLQVREICKKAQIKSLKREME